MELLRGGGTPLTWVWSEGEVRSAPEVRRWAAKGCSAACAPSKGLLRLCGELVASRDAPYCTLRDGLATLAPSAAVRAESLDAVVRAAVRRGLSVLDASGCVRVSARPHPLPLLQALRRLEEQSAAELHVAGTRCVWAFRGPRGELSIAAGDAPEAQQLARYGFEYDRPEQAWVATRDVGSAPRARAILALCAAGARERLSLMLHPPRPLSVHAPDGGPHIRHVSEVAR